MTIINHMKDGTVVEDMSNVTVPKENVEAVIKILTKKKVKHEKINKSKNE